MDAPQPRHVVIVGAGAVGITLATCLRESGHRVTLVVRRPDSVKLPITLDDGIVHRSRLLHDLQVCEVNALPSEPDHVVVCTRGDQLEPALHSLRGRIRSHVPITVAAATLEDLRALAHRIDLPNPILRMGVGFGVWLVGPSRFRLFSLGRQGSAIACEVDGKGARARDELARLLHAAGLPCRAAPTMPFRWLFRTILAMEVAWLHAYRKTNWDLDELARSPALLELCGAAMRESARTMHAEAGLVARVSSLVPGTVLARMARRRALRASQDFRDIWRHHGPKTEEQLHYLTAQLVARAGTTPRALGVLASP